MGFVVIAEPDEVNAARIKTILDSLDKDFSYALVGSAEAAIQLVEQNTTDVFIADMQMPVMEGIEATKKIRNSVREDNDVPIFAMTANTFATDRKRCADAGMTRVYSETGELKRDSDDAGRESADGMRRITGRINNRKIWRRGSTALDCSGAFLCVS